MAHEKTINLRKFSASVEVTENFATIAFAPKFWLKRSSDASGTLDGFLSSWGYKLLFDTCIAHKVTPLL